MGNAEYMGIAVNSHRSIAQHTRSIVNMKFAVVAASLATVASAEAYYGGYGLGGYGGYGYGGYGKRAADAEPAADAEAKPEAEASPAPYYGGYGLGGYGGYGYGGYGG